ncbi:hypothetical protein BJ878DRAFT_546780 [Calycina marina]|uniref:Uncharacterized protein n=1 Tax=Calycina marina TaxID=1763456 RepID=A0A9P7YTZ0_9HELO|nr:hypothetical protein BJ878DRAFT_546780 [Calycina marina]
MRLTLYFLLFLRATSAGRSWYPHQTTSFSSLSSPAATPEVKPLDVINDTGARNLQVRGDNVQKRLPTGACLQSLPLPCLQISSAADSEVLNLQTSCQTALGNAGVSLLDYSVCFLTSTTTYVLGQGNNIVQCLSDGVLCRNCLAKLPQACLSLQDATFVTITAQRLLCRIALTLGGAVIGLTSTTNCLAGSNGPGILTCLRGTVLCPSCVSTLPPACTALRTTPQSGLLLQEAACIVALTLTLDVVDTASITLCLVTTDVDILTGFGTNVYNCLAAAIGCPGSFTTVTSTTYIASGSSAYTSTIPQSGTVPAQVIIGDPSATITVTTLIPSDATAYTSTIPQSGTVDDDDDDDYFRPVRPPEGYKDVLS